MPDYYDQEHLRIYAEETVRLANEYKKARIAFADAYIQLDIALVKKYQEKKIPNSMAKDKAWLHLIAQDEEYQDIYDSMIHNQQLYKGLEKVIEARKQLTSQEQSFIKNRIQENV